MSKLETLEAQALAGEVTIWLPLHLPVITLTISRAETQDIVWQIAHESFRPIAASKGELQINFDRIRVEYLHGDAASHGRSVDSTSSLRYGEAPPGMKQFIPANGEPPQLESGVSYIIAVRQRPDTDVRWFSLQIE